MSLKDRIAAQIAAEGPMPFERFMDLSLYSADGFFGGETLRSERGGDFLTSPEVSNLFGETLARYVAAERERIGDPFTLVEVGAGSGSLLRPLLATTAVDALAVEASPAARAALAHLVPVAEQMPDHLRGVILANELLDNLPMVLAEKVEGRWRERWVGLDGEALSLIDADPRPEVLAWLESYAGPVTDGGWVEVQIEATRWLDRALGSLEEGSVVVIDYGDTAEGLLPRRSDGTLRTYRSHHLGPHPLDEPGGTDITADVNFTALADVASQKGARVELHRQDDFLISLGLGERLSEIRHAELEAARAGDHQRRLELRSLRTEAETLLHPRGLGDFRVLVALVGGTGDGVAGVKEL